MSNNQGKTPAVALVNPKYPHNVGAAVRAASCYGIAQVWITGDRVALEPHPGYRLPREERMRGYKDVTLARDDRFFDQFPGAVPVAVELVPGAESLIDFEHPDNALYTFGPEDGSLNRATLGQCHRFVTIPTRYCTNLASAVYTVLYDRHAKRVRAGLELPNTVTQDSAFDEPDDMTSLVGVTRGRR